MNLSSRSSVNALSCARAFGRACADVPVIGRYLEPFGTFAAVGVWGSRLVPDIARALTQPRAAQPVTAVAVEPVVSIVEACGGSLLDIIANVPGIDWPKPQRFAPVLRMAQQRSRFVYRSAVKYGPQAGQLLDVWRAQDLPAGPAPVLIFLPGGAWVHGSRKYQGSELLAQLAAMGWVCLAIDYRVSPRHRWPRHIRDVKAAIAWARANADEFGGDRNFVAVAGCSAGGHLASLAGLSVGDPNYESELEPGADTSVDAVVSLYGRYDWDDRSTNERDGFVDFLEHLVVQRDYSQHREMFRSASPILRAADMAPPFFVVHGTGDVVIPVAQARAFVDTMRTHSRAPVGYLELPGAQHGFDLIDGGRSGPALTAVGLFLNEMYRRHTIARTVTAS